jgi:predicted nuclease of predicted toxin-antitoxin system
MKLLLDENLSRRIVPFLQNAPKPLTFTPELGIIT